MHGFRIPEHDVSYTSWPISVPIKRIARNISDTAEIDQWPIVEVQKSSLVETSNRQPYHYRGFVFNLIDRLQKTPKDKGIG